MVTPICQPNDDRLKGTLQGPRHCTTSTMLPSGSTRVVVEDNAIAACPDLCDYQPRFAGIWKYGRAKMNRSLFYCSRATNRARDDFVAAWS